MSPSFKTFLVSLIILGLARNIYVWMKLWLLIWKFLVRSEKKQFYLCFVSWSDKVTFWIDVWQITSWPNSMTSHIELNAIVFKSSTLLQLMLKPPQMITVRRVVIISLRKGVNKSKNYVVDNWCVLDYLLGTIHYQDMYCRRVNNEYSDIFFCPESTNLIWSVFLNKIAFLLPDWKWGTSIKLKLGIF